MRKINLEKYATNEVGQDKKPIMYDVQGSLVGILYHPELRLGALEIINREATLKKIRGANGYVLLEEEEYNKLVNSTKQINGFGINEIELVHRIMDAEQIEVEQKK